MTSNYRVDVPLLPPGKDAWFTIRSDDLEHEVQVKIKLLGPDRPIVTAVRIDDEREVTSRQIRTLRLPVIARAVLNTVRELADHLDEDGEFDSDIVAALTYFHPEVDAAVDAGAGALMLRTWLAAVEDAASGLEDGPRGRGAQTPSDDDFRTFARVYLEEQLRDERGVAARTARRLYMARPTAYRWRSICRERGLLPADEAML